jgi:hypothetical protein
LKAKKQKQKQARQDKKEPQLFSPQPPKALSKVVRARKKKPFALQAEYADILHEHEEIMKKQNAVLGRSPARGRQPRFDDVADDNNNDSDGDSD